MFGTHWYLRGAYSHTQKSYATFAERDTTSDTMRLDSYLLHDGMNHYFALGLQSSVEEAHSREFDFDSQSAQLGWGYRADLTGNDVMLKAQLRYEQREYGSTRIDNRVRARLAAMVPFSEHVSVGVSVERTSNTSNNSEANLDRTVFGMEFGVSF